MDITLGQQFKKIQQLRKEQAVSEQAAKDAAILKKELNEKEIINTFFELIEEYLTVCASNGLLPSAVSLRKREYVKHQEDVNQYFVVNQEVIGELFTSYPHPYIKKHSHMYANFVAFEEKMEAQGVKIIVEMNHDGMGRESWVVIKFGF